MVQDLFVYNNQLNRVDLNIPEILLVKEFKSLLDPKRNKCKDDPKGVFGLRAFREFTYIWLALCWKSVYSDYNEQDRHKEALKDSGLTEKSLMIQSLEVLVGNIDRFRNLIFLLECYMQHRRLLINLQNILTLQILQKEMNRQINLYTK